MADRFVSTTGSNTSPYETWAKAATTLTTAIAGSAAEDRFILDVASPQAAIAANTTYTFLGNAKIIASTNSGTSTVTPAIMGAASGFIGNSASPFNITIGGAFKLYFYGVTFRGGGSSNPANLNMAITDGAHYEFEDCYFYLNTDGASFVAFGGGNASETTYSRLKRPTFIFGNVSQQIRPRCITDIEGGLVSPSGSAPTTLMANTGILAKITWAGGDISHVTGTLVGGSGNSNAAEYNFLQCRLGTGVTVLATQIPLNKGSARVNILDCAVGDTHGLFGYYDAFGSCVSDTGIYFTSGAAAQSWKVTTTANCSYYTPFVTPWVPGYNSGSSSITPYLEILRDGSATAYQDDEVWGEFAAKTTSGSTQATFYDDSMALAGTPANQAAGAGLGSWTGESGTAWSGKVDSGSAFTPVELGDLSARLVVGEPSITVYFDPFFRT